MSSEILVKDYGERLVDVEAYCPLVWVKNPPQYLREGVAERLKVATENLIKERPDLTFCLNSGWRSAAKQEALFWEQFYLLERRNSAWVAERVMKEANKYVAPSSGLDVSGHLTGGALHLILAFVKTGRKVPMVSSSLTFQENAKTFQSKLSRHIREKRWLMFCVLAKVGFVNVEHEFWHWSFGDRVWAEKTGQSAIYGIIESLY